MDNDVLIKLSAYRLLVDGLGVLGGPDAVGVLGAARFVVPSAIMRHDRIRDREGAAAEWSAMAGLVEALEPSAEELNLATAIEETASRRGLPLDSGESQLCAVAVQRSLTHLVTGDKRAILAAEAIASEATELSVLAGRVVCLEQLVDRLMEDLTGEVVQRSVCSEDLLDRALSACLGCASLVDGLPVDQAGLESYIADLRSKAPVLLSLELAR